MPPVKKTSARIHPEVLAAFDVAAENAGLSRSRAVCACLRKPQTWIKRNTLLPLEDGEVNRRITNVHIPPRLRVSSDRLAKSLGLSMSGLIERVMRRAAVEGVDL